jgi:DNA polymerase I-like protein with 3'-5' exonuclease and polymerase domains
MEGEPYRDLKKSGRHGDKDKRNIIKPVALGIPYGARGPQVANLMELKQEIIDRKTGLKRTVLDVELGWQKRTQYLETYKALHDYMIRMENDCMTKGYVKTLIGRKRHFVYAPFIFDLLNAYRVSVDDFLDAKYSTLEKPNTEMGLNKEGLELFCKQFKMKYSDVAEKGFWSYVRSLFKNEHNNAKNHPIQGLAGHITNRGMLDTNRRFNAENLDAWVILQVHDEITCYAREDQAEAAKECLKLGMEKNIFTAKIDIPMIAEPIICDNLKDSK